MKYLIIPYIALGFVLSSAISINYNCDEWELFPEYIGSPFVFKQKSLGSSMTYFYSISGILLNITVWSILILLIQNTFINVTNRIRKNKLIKSIYKGLVIGLIAFTTLNVSLDIMMLGSGFEKGRNYWYMNLDNESKSWRVKCEGEWRIFWK